MRLAACIVLLFLACAAAGPAQTVGDVLETVPFPEGYTPSENHFAFDRLTGRFYFLDSHSVAVTDRAGTLLRELDTTDSPNRAAFWDARGCCGNGATFVSGNTWTLIAGRNTVSVWTVTDDGDGTATITPGAGYTLDQVLPTHCITAYDRADDGAWWVICGETVYLLSPDGSAIRESIAFEEIERRISGSDDAMTVYPHLLGFDEVSNSLLMALRWTQEGIYAIYRYDVQGRFQEGRFLAPSYITPTLALAQGCRLEGDVDQVHFYDAQDQVIRTHATPLTDLPRLLSADFAEEGIMWVTCLSSQSPFNTTAIQFQVDWEGEAASPGFYVVDGMSLLVPPQSGGTISATLRKTDLPSHGANPTSVILLRNTDGQLSPPQEIELPLAAYDGPVLFDRGCNIFLTQTIDQKKTTWSYNGAAPMEPFNAFVEFADFVPWVGGKRYGIKDVQMSGKVEIASKDDASTAISGGGAFDFGSGKLRMEFGGGVLQELKFEGPELTGAIATVKLAGTVQEDAGLTDLFPALAPIGQSVLFGSAFRWLNTRAKLTASITAGIDASTKFKQNMAKDLLIEGEITGFLALSVAAALRLMDGYAEVSAFGEGKAAMTFTPNDGGLSFKQSTLSLLVGAKIRAYLLERSVQRVVSITLGGSQGGMRELPNGGLISDSGPRYAFGADSARGVPEAPVRPHVITPNPYESLLQMERGGAPVTGPESFDHEIAVLGGLPSDTAISVADGKGDDSGRMMLVWSQPIAGKQATQATDIFFSFFDGIRFSEPAPLNDDDRMDFNPRVTNFGEGFWVAVWERVGLSDFLPTGDPELDNEVLIANLRPAWAFYNSATGQWSDVREMPVSGMNGFKVQAIHSNLLGGGIAWLESDTGSLLPWDLNAEPVSTGRIGGVRLKYTFFDLVGPANEDMSTFGVITLGEQDPSVGVIDDVVEYSIVRHSSFNSILVSRMEDVTTLSPFVADLRIETWFQQLFVSSSAMRRQSRQSGATVSSNPVILGTPGFGGSFDMYHVETHSSGNPVAHLGPSIYFGGGSSPAFHDFVERPSDYDASDGKYYSGSALLGYAPWAYMPEEGVTRRYIAYPQTDQDGQPNIFIGAQSNRVPGPVVHDAGSLEKQVHLGNFPDGSLRIAYLKSALRKEPMMVDIEGEMTEVTDISEEPFAQFSITRHITATELLPGRVAVKGGVAKAGKTVVIEAEVRNPGDFGIGSPELSLYAYPLDGARATGLIPIVENHAIGQTLMGNSSFTAEIEWTIPESGRYGLALIVDPSNKVEEYDEGNNMAMNDNALLVPAEVVEWLLGRFNSPAALDTNTDGVIDSADIE